MQCFNFSTKGSRIVLTFLWGRYTLEMDFQEHQLNLQVTSPINLFYQLSLKHPYIITLLMVVWNKLQLTAQPKISAQFLKQLNNIVNITIATLCYIVNISLFSSNYSKRKSSQIPIIKATSIIIKLKSTIKQWAIFLKRFFICRV